MVKRRRNATSVVQSVFPSSGNAYYFLSNTQTTVQLNHPCIIIVFLVLSSAHFGCHFFGLFPHAVVCSYLAPLSCTQHPVCTGAGQTLSVFDAEDISQAITFSAWARYLYNWVLPAVGVLERESENGKKKKRREKRKNNDGGGGRGGALKGQFPFPPGPR